MSHITELVKARLAAIERGDKALGREIYHHLVNLGFSGEDIDANRIPIEPEPVPEPEVEPEPEPEVAETPPVLEKAVKEPAETRDT